MATSTAVAAPARDPARALALSSALKRSLSASRELQAQQPKRKKRNRRKPSRDCHGGGHKYIITDASERLAASRIRK